MAEKGLAKVELEMDQVVLELELVEVLESASVSEDWVSVWVESV